MQLKYAIIIAAPEHANLRHRFGKVGVEPDGEPRQRHVIGEARQRIDREFQPRAGAARRGELLDRPVLLRQLRGAHLRGLRHRVAARECGQLIPVGEIDRAVCGKEPGEPLAIEWHVVVSMPDQRFKESGLIACEVLRRKKLRAQKGGEIAFERLLHPSVRSWASACRLMQEHVKNSA